MIALSLSKLRHVFFSYFESSYSARYHYQLTGIKLKLIHQLGAKSPEILVTRPEPSNYFRSSHQSFSSSLPSHRIGFETNHFLMLQKAFEGVVVTSQFLVARNRMDVGMAFSTNVYTPCIHFLPGIPFPEPLVAVASLWDQVMECQREVLFANLTVFGLRSSHLFFRYAYQR